MGFTPFHYKNLEELQADCAAQSLDFRFSQNSAALAKTISVGSHTTPNALAVHPMEGSDGESDGSPGELTGRRYDRFARGGAGLLWFEAVAVLPEARATARHLWIH